MPGFAGGISAPAVTASALLPTPYTRLFAVPGVASSAVFRLGACPTQRRWDVELQARMLVANTQMLLAPVIATAAVTWPRTAATPAAGVTVPDTKAILVPRSHQAGAGNSGPVWLAGTAGLISYPGGTAAAAPVPAGSSAVCVSPDGRWVFAATAANVLHAYPVRRIVPSATATGLTLGAAITDPVSAPTVGNIASIDVAPDGKSVAIAGDTSPYVELYAFDPSAGAWGDKAAAPGSLPAGAGKSVRISPDGTMLALGHATSPFVALYAITGGPAPAFGNKAANPAGLPPAQGNAVSWHVSSGYIALMTAGTAAATRFVLYPVTGGATPAFGATIATNTASPGSLGNACAFSPDGAYVVATVQAAAAPIVFPFAAGVIGASFTSATVTFTTVGDRTIDWSADSLSILHTSAATTTLIQSWLLPAATFWLPDGAGWRFPGPLLAPAIAASNEIVSGRVSFSMAAGEELYLLPSQTAANIAELVAYIKEYTA